MFRFAADIYCVMDKNIQTFMQFFRFIIKCSFVSLNCSRRIQVHAVVHIIKCENTLSVITPNSV